jgi:MSHA pilin protein MshA
LHNLKKQNGFTLIELVVVIVIIGTLAITAAPKFINVSSDARKSTLQAFKGTLKSQTRMVHLACRLTPGCLNATWGQIIYVKALGQNVQILRGYPDAGELWSTNQIDDIIEYSGFDLTSEDNAETARWSFPGTTNC